MTLIMFLCVCVCFFKLRCQTGEAVQSVQPVRRLSIMQRRSSVMGGASIKPASYAVGTLCLSSHSLYRSNVKDIFMTGGNMINKRTKKKLQRPGKKTSENLIFSKSTYIGVKRFKNHNLQLFVEISFSICLLNRFVKSWTECCFKFQSKKIKMDFSHHTEENSKI